MLETHLNKLLQIIFAKLARRPWLCSKAHRRKNWLFSDTPRDAEASAAIYSIVVTAKQNGLNQRAYIEWLLTEMPNDDELDEPGRIDRYLPWSDDVPQECRLSPEKAAIAAEMPDEPIIDLETVEGVLENS